MCLAIPMKIIEINNFDALCEAGGIRRQVNLFMLQHKPLQTGDFVMVHIGYAIEKIEAKEARTRWDLYDEMQSTETP